MLGFASRTLPTQTCLAAELRRLRGAALAELAPRGGPGQRNVAARPAGWLRKDCRLVQQPGIEHAGERIQGLVGPFDSSAAQRSP